MSMLFAKICQSPHDSDPCLPSTRGTHPLSIYLNSAEHPVQPSQEQNKLWMPEGKSPCSRRIQQINTLGWHKIWGTGLDD